jgi:hypothetical protein
MRQKKVISDAIRSYSQGPSPNQICEVKTKFAVEVIPEIIVHLPDRSKRCG